ncbi:MAG: hypothetical protein ACOH16_14120 [Propionibacteriaceae bacterium]
METDSLDAQSALDAVAAAERSSAEIATSTPWYAPWYGVTCAAFPVAIALLAARSPVGIAVLVMGMASLALLVQTYRRVTGVWPSGQGMTLYIAAAIAVMLGAGSGCYLAATAYGVGWWVLAVALATAVLMAVLSHQYDLAFVRKHGVR